MLNKVTLIGNLGADPEVRQMPNGSAVATVSIATTRRWKDKQSGEKRDATEWHRVVFFNRLADIAGEYLKKGSQVYVEGMLQTRKWEKDGQDHYTTEIVCREMTMLGGKGAADESGKNAPTGKPPTYKATPAAMPQAPMPDYQDFDQDIPF